jgi:hypothetical protein
LGHGIFENPGQTGFEFVNNLQNWDKYRQGLEFTAVPTGQRWAGCETASGSIGTRN